MFPIIVKFHLETPNCEVTSQLRVLVNDLELTNSFVDTNDITITVQSLQELRRSLTLIFDMLAANHYTYTITT